MLKKMLITVFCVFSIFYSQNSFSQEIPKERTTEYTIKLNRVKTQNQVDVTITQTKDIKNVTLSSFDWNTYEITIKVKEGGEYGVLSLQDVKIILLKNDMELVKFTKKEIK